MKDYIIVANGDFLVSEIIHEAVKNKMIIALDTAADKLSRLGMMPHILLGDFDSDSETHAHYWGIHHTLEHLSEDDKPYKGNFDVTIVPRKNQNLTDLVKAIQYCDEQAAHSITIICALGGRLDHHEAAMRSLRAEYKKQRPILLHSSLQTIRYVKDEHIILQGNTGDKCGILAYPKGWFSSEGLAYDAHDYALDFAYSESVANAMRLPQATVSVTGEALLIMPPQLQSQREYMKKSETEQLELLLRDARQDSRNDSTDARSSR